ncbi:hypothetical protein, partial [Streptomyces cyaneofuscatus]|uniref:hypothetical protein n=1 Tax=Streptomyces cyaneofuscatus TaxID=66883 RepID=UPI0034298A8E
METLYRLSYWGLAALWQRGKPYTGSEDAHNRGRREFADLLGDRPTQEVSGPERRKAPHHKGAGLSRKNCSAASYSPTGSPL